MNASQQNFTNQFSPSNNNESKDANFFAFFDKPSAENLSANRSGILSQPQLTALQTYISYQKNSNAIVIGTLILSAMFLIFLFWKIDTADGALSITAQVINASIVIVILGIFAGYLTGDWVVFSMHDDLENRAVESATGTVAWDGKRYRMQTDSRTLRSLRQGVVLPPGDYCFYYLPHSGLVVMAEEVETSPESHESILLRTLASANGFSLDELKTNRDGHLSRHQENELLWIAVFSVVVGLSIGALCVVLLPRVFQALAAPGIAVTLLIGSILFLRFGWDASRIISDVWHGETSKVEGPVSRKVRRTRYSISYYYVSGPHRFRVSKNAYNALIEGKTYRIFYVHRSKRLVSIEPA